MDPNLLWKAVLIVFAGTFLLRIAGRKSISQMTLAQTVIMIAIGTLLIQPVSGANIWTALVMGSILVLTLILLEFLQVKFDFFEKMITGKSKILIEDGKIQEKTLRKLRLTIDQLEMQLRHQNVTKLSDVQWATLEPSGKIGIDLKEDAKPVTKKEFQLLQQQIQAINTYIQATSQNTVVPSSTSLQEKEQQDLFNEVKYKKHIKKDPPSYLQ